MSPNLGKELSCRPGIGSKGAAGSAELTLEERIVLPASC